MYVLKVLGSVLVCSAVGGLAALPVVAYVQDKTGSAKCLLFGNIVLAGLMPILGISGVGLVLLYPTFFCVGIGFAFSDLAMTAQGVAVEKELHRNHMGFFQAMLSIGNFVGVLFGGSMAFIGLTPLENFFIVATGSIPVTCWVYRFLTPYDVELKLHAQEKETEEGVIELVEGTTNINYDNIDNIVVEECDTCNDGTVDGDASGSVDSDGDSDGDSASVSMSPSARNVLVYLSISGLCAQVGEGTIGDW
jgi:hypothetical protein